MAGILIHNNSSSSKGISNPAKDEKNFKQTTEGSSDQKTKTKQLEERNQSLEKNLRDASQKIESLEHELQALKASQLNDVARQASGASSEEFEELRKQRDTLAENLAYSETRFRAYEKAYHEETESLRQQLKLLSDKNAELTLKISSMNLNLD